MKKTRSMILALVMVFAMASAALAADPTSEVTVTAEGPTINLNIPTTGAAKLNPYKIALDIGNDQTSSAGVVHRTVVVANRSNCGLDVYAKVQAVPSDANSNITFESDTPNWQANNTDKKAFLYLKAEVGTNEEGTIADAAYAAANDMQVITNTVNKLPGETGSGTEAVKVLALTKPTGDDPNYFMYRIMGDANPYATWTAADVVNVSITWKFIPTVATTTTTTTTSP